jgi:RNA polymerase primary sigma factor
VGSINRLSKVYSELEQKFQREPSVAELAEALELTPAEITDSMRISGRHVSVNAPFAHGEENSLLDVLENDDKTPDSGLIDDSLRTEVQRALAALTQRESSILTLYYGLGGTKALTLEEIGERFHLTRERVRQIKQTATNKLGKSLQSKALRAYL